MFQLGLFHQQFIRGAFVTLDLLLLNLLHQSFLLGFQKVQLLQSKGEENSKGGGAGLPSGSSFGQQCEMDRFHYLLVVDKLLANLAGVDPIQAAAAFG